MSYFDYMQSIEICKGEPSFYSLIMAAMRQADDQNTDKLRHAWPDVYEELMTRYHSPGGILPSKKRRSAR